MVETDIPKTRIGPRFHEDPTYLFRDAEAPAAKRPRYSLRFAVFCLVLTALTAAGAIGFHLGKAPYSRGYRAGHAAGLHTCPAE
jgi:hypothetical protein